MPIVYGGVVGVFHCVQRSMVSVVERVWKGAMMLGWLRRLVVLLVCCAVVVVGGVTEAVAEPGGRVPTDWLPGVQEWVPVKASSVSGGVRERGGVVPASAVIRVPRAAKTGEFSASSLGAGWARVGDSAVEVGGVSAAKVRVVPLTGKAASVGARMVVSVSTVGTGSSVKGGQGAGRVRVDARALGLGGGAGLLERSRLVQLVGCTLGDQGDCSGVVPLSGAVVDPVLGTIAADLPRTAFVGADVSHGGESAGVILAVVSAPAGGSGSFAAQPLGGSSLWSGGSSTGEFTWSYPVKVPSVVGEVAPRVGLSYSSSVVDGRVASTNNQPGWIGQGWSYEPGFIERTYLPCSEVSGAPKTGDLCWWDQTVSMNLGGSSAVLVKDQATGVWHPKVDDGTRIEQVMGAPNGAYQGEHWKVTTTDGLVFWFGRHALPGRTTEALTNSTFTVPVYGAKSGDPCFSSSGFAASRCDQGWRWNLDYVEDTRGNAAAYYYTKETNYYQANATTRVGYVRGGTLARIEYGLRQAGGSVYGSAAAARVVFDTAERCLPTASFDCSPSKFTTVNAAFWPDTPQDLSCSASGECGQVSPSFWSQRRLVKITTQVRSSSGDYSPVDSYALTHTFPDQGDASLWLSQLTHTGYGENGTSLSRAPVVFEGDVLANRVDGYLNLPPMLMRRLTRVTDEVGGVTSATYSAPECTASNVPALTSLSSNQKRCFPVRWTLPFQSAPTTDFFHKYVVTTVRQADRAATSPARVTTYRYGGSPAWHFDDNELTKPGERTWGQFRGYAQVDTLFGDTDNVTNSAKDVQTRTSSLFFRGMNGNTVSGGGTASVSVTNSVGESLVDADELAGRVYETRTHLGDTDTVVSKQLTDYVISSPTASRPREGLSALEARRVGESRTRTVTMIAGGGSQTATTTMRYDSEGRLDAQTESGDSIPAVCTTTSFATNDAAHIRVLPAEVNTYQGTCPATGSPTGTLVKSQRRFYDNSTTLGVVPGPGNQTRAQQAITITNGTIEYATDTTEFDVMGRPTKVTEYTSPADTTGRVTTTAYTPAVGGPVQQVVVTNPVGVRATSTYDQQGRLTKTASSVGTSTEASYDALGRISAVWEPGYPRTGPATTTYSYTDNPDSADVMTTSTITQLNPEVRRTTIALSDAFGQVIQTQTDAANGGRVVDDTFYDSHGWPIKKHNHWYTLGAPTPTQLTTTDSGINSRQVITYDAAGRATGTIDFTGTTETRRARTVYSGNQTTLFPPTGGMITATLHDAYGRTTSKREYTTTPTINTNNTVTGGEYTTTSYSYDHDGQMVGLSDATGAQWGFTYDMAGRKTSTSDPDAGVSTTTYTHTGEVLTTVDARGEAGTLTYTYDQAGRVLTLNGGVGNKPIGKWTYDTLRTGLLTQIESYQDETTTNPYVQRITGYDTYARPTGTELLVPPNAGALAGSYTTTTTYTPTGQPATTTLSAGGGLPAETLTTTYTPTGLPATMTGLAPYIGAVTYNPFGMISQHTGRENNTVATSYTYNQETLTTTSTTLSGATTRPMISSHTYTRDQVGKITRATTLMNYASPAASRTMCYGYDTLERLTHAWTAKDNCAQTPTPGTGSNTQVGGTNAIWQTYTFNPVGARTSYTSHQIPGKTNPTTTTTTTFTTPDHPHAPTTTTTIGATPTNTTISYDPAGNTLTRTTGTAVETFTWNAHGRDDTVTKNGATSRIIYDATGTILGRTDSAGTTLYTPVGDLHANPTGQVSGERQYNFAGKTIAQRSNTGAVVGLFTDQVGTGTATLDWADLTKVTWRLTDPYGTILATALGTWPTQRAYLNQPTDPTSGLIQTGARLYDPTQGRFLSVDPMLGPGTPQSLNSYAYTQADPINTSDPTGLWSWRDGWNAVKNFAGGAASYVVGSALDLAQGVGTVATFAVTRDWNRSVQLNESWSNQARAGYQRFEDYLGIDRTSLAYKAGYATAMVADMAIGGVGLAKAGYHLGKAAYKGVKVLAKQGAKGTAKAVVAKAARTIQHQAERVKTAYNTIKNTHTPPTTTAAKAETQVVRHYTTSGAADSILKEGAIKPGPVSGKVWLTPDKYGNGAEAQARLALNKTPDGYFEIPMCRVRCPSAPSVVEPFYGQPGGGLEITTPFKVPVVGLHFVPFG